MKGNRVFFTTCSFLGLVALAQVLIASMSIAARIERSSQVRVITQEVEPRRPIEMIPPPTPAFPYREAPREPVPTVDALVEAEPLSMPTVADPRSERLLDQARRAKIAGDMGKAIVKLEEALAESPEDPTLLFEMGMIHELMGVYDRAAQYYEGVFRQGISGSGQLYKAAAAKLRDGFDRPNQMVGKMALGRVRIFNDPKAEGGQKVIISVPVEKAPSVKVETAEIVAEVHFFNKTSKGEIVKLEDDSWASYKWTTNPIDWVTGSETLQVTYQIPNQSRTTNHLFGELAYYGQVVTLSYAGEVVDVQAWPRGLSARMSDGVEDQDDYEDIPEFLNDGLLPEKFDPNLPSYEPLPTN